MRDLDDIGDLKRAARPYAVNEKVGVHDVLRANPNILDVEIAFGTSGTNESDPRTRSIDFAAIQESDSGARLVFYEAKLFGNHAKLRKSGDAVSDVVLQIEIYSRELRANHDAVSESYRRVCGNVMSLHGVSERFETCMTMLEGIESGSRKLYIDVSPVLAVFGFDADQKDGTK